MTRTSVLRPLVWLAAQAALLVAAFLVCDRFQLMPDDKDGYLRLVQAGAWDLSTVTESLATTGDQQRTFGYPAFLRLVLRWSPSLALLPLCQLVVRLVAVGLVFLGLRRIGLRGWLAAASAGILLYSNNMFHWANCIITDAVAESLAIATVGLLLMVVGRPRSALAWFGFTVSLFLTYQTHPSYLFLVVLLPVLGVLLLGLVAPRPEWLRRRCRLALGLVAACGLPFLAFCTLRWVVVDHFGLVSYGGYALIGAVGDSLTPDLVPDLPEDLQPLARAVLKRQDEDASRPADFEPAPFDAWRATGFLARSGEITGEHSCTSQIMTYYAWGLYIPTAIDLCQGDRIAADKLLTRMSWALIRARPGAYASGVAGRFWLAIGFLLFNQYALVWLLLLLALLLVVWHVCYVIRQLRANRSAAGAAELGGPSYALAFNVLLLVALSFALGKSLLTSLVTATDNRYIDAAGVFLPAAAVAGVFAVWRQITGKHLGALSLVLSFPLLIMIGYGKGDEAAKSSAKAEDADYRQMLRQIRETAERLLPAGATVLVASKGDDDLLQLPGRTAYHFPQRKDGSYLGYTPDEDEAIANLEAAHAKGAQFLLFPRTASWWLEDYQKFRRHLEGCYQRVPSGESCVIYRLSAPAVEPPAGAPATEPPAKAAASGEDPGVLDNADRDVISGWAWNRNEPDNAVKVDVFDRDTLLGSVVADMPRDDLVKAGKGNGRHGFSYPSPAALRDGKEHTIHVRISGTGLELYGSPITLQKN